MSSELSISVLLDIKKQKNLEIQNKIFENQIDIVKNLITNTNTKTNDKLINHNDITDFYNKIKYDIIPEILKRINSNNSHFLFSQKSVVNVVEELNALLNNVKVKYKIKDQ